VFANELDFQAQLDDWFEQRANARMHKTLRCRPVDRLAEERDVMAPLPATAPDTDRRWVLRVPADRHLRFDTPTVTRSTRRSRGAGPRPASQSASSQRSVWTPASWPAATGAALPSTARLRRSSTPAP
jgi:hypothetical protein